MNQFAPGLASFARPSIPDLQAEYQDARHWLQDYFLFAVVGQRLPALNAQVALGMVRRAERGFRYYHDARAATLECAKMNSHLRPPVALYYEALADWENFALQYQMSIDLYNRLGAGRVYDSGDGSVAERLCGLANDAKHSGRSPVPSVIDSDLTLPMWFDSEGVAGSQGRLSYEEIADALRNLCEFARGLVNPGASPKLPDSVSRAP